MIRVICFQNKFLNLIFEIVKKWRPKVRFIYFYQMFFLNKMENHKTIKGKVIFIDKTHPVLPEKLSSAGFVSEHFTDKNYDWYQEVIDQYEGIIVRSRIKLDRNLIARASRVKFIGRLGSGLENIDVGYATERGIACFNSPEGNRDAVGEHALGMILSLFHNIVRSNHEVKNGIWHREPNRGIELMGKTIGIIGYGNMGRSFAQRLAGLQCNVLAYDKFKSGFSDQFVTESTMEEIFSKTDVLSFHVPLKEDTFNLFDESYLSRFKKPIWLINTSRGKVVKTSDLVKGLKSGKVNGACLDVLEYENLSFESIQQSDYPEDLQFLMGAENVILSPHIAGLTAESHYKLAAVLAEKIDNFIQNMNR